MADFENFLIFVLTLRCFQEYGGYVASLLLSADLSPARCGAVLSPVTDFELYGEAPSAIDR